MDEQIRHAVFVERYKVYLAKLFNKTVDEIDEYLQALLVKHDIASLSPKELKRITKESNNAFLTALLNYNAILKQEWSEFVPLVVQTEAKFAKTAVNLATEGLMIEFLTKPQRITQGVSLDELMSKFSKNEADRLTSVIRLAHQDGWTNHELIKKIRGTRAGKFKDGILQTTRRHAETLARTGTAIMAGEAQKEFAEQNRDLVKGVQIVATLDRRTSVKCRSLDKKIMPLDKAIYPPYHINCRSRTILVYKGMKEPPQRTSEHGVTDNVSYYEWLKTQSPAFQDEALGKARGKLFREGGLSPERFSALQLDRNFEPLTLDEMRRLEPLVFDKVFKKSSNTTTRYQTIHMGNLKPRPSEVARLQIEPTKRGEKPKTPRPAEAELADLLQQYFDIYLVRYDDRYHKASPTGSPPDFAKKDNELPVKQWQTLDLMFTMLANDSKGIDAMNHAISTHKRHGKNWRVLQQQIIDHIEKSDIVPLDLRCWNDENYVKIIGFVLSLSQEQQRKIIFIED